jgi:hypothetical protein
MAVSEAIDVTSIVSPLARAANHLSQFVANGASIWTVAIGMDDHAQHLAVEFVHPASVGAASVPAVAVTGGRDTVIAELRHQTRRGDVVISMGDCGSGFPAELSVRAKAWGVAHLHIGWSRAGIGGTEIDGLDPESLYVRLGENSQAEQWLTRSYHLLWELTFICMQNAPIAAGVPTAAASCSVCSDQATVAEISELQPPNQALVRTECGIVRVDVTALDMPSIFDLVLLHAGVAIQQLPTHRFGLGHV